MKPGTVYNPHSHKDELSPLLLISRLSDDSLAASSPSKAELLRICRAPSALFQVLAGQDGGGLIVTGPYGDFHHIFLSVNVS